ITSPGAGTKFIAPRNLRITASASDFDGAVVKVDFYDGVTLLGSATTAPFAFTFANAAAGLHTLVAVASDDQGATRRSTPVAVTGVTDFGTQPGHLDGNFLAFGSDGGVQAIALQADGKLLAGGSFASINDLPRGRFVRLGADGTVDPAYNPTLSF